MKKVDLTGYQKPGSFLIVVSLIENSKPRKWLCKCTFNGCGKTVELTASQVAGDRSYKSCGCYKNSTACKQKTRTAFKDYVKENW